MLDLSGPATACHTLIVEDDSDSRDAMAKALRLYGYDADCAGTFLEGVAKLTSGTRWLILDLRLPDGDGATLLRYIREHELPVKVAVVTGAADGSLLTEAVLLKPEAFFTKPVDVADVAVWLASHDDHGGDGESLSSMPWLT
jgi:DNA-binding NtrC family response regulator